MSRKPQHVSTSRFECPACRATFNAKRIRKDLAASRSRQETCPECSATFWTREFIPVEA